MRRTLLVTLMMTMTLVAAACSSDSSDDGAPSTTSSRATTTTTSAPAPEPLADQTAPPAINGITIQGDTIWVASIKGDQLVQIDRSTGEILQRIATDGAGPDDVAVAPDGSVWSTGFANGDVGRVDPDGTYEVITEMAPGINPIEFAGDGTLYIGTYGPEGTMYRVPTDGGKPVVVATDLPDINGFGILDDGTIVAPSGGIAGPGGAVAIDPRSGKVTQLVTGLASTAAGATDADGQPYVLGNISGEVMSIDVAANTSEVVHTATSGAPFDNIAFAPDGTIYLSSFTAPVIIEVSPDGTERTIPVGTPVATQGG